MPNEDEQQQNGGEPSPSSSENIEIPPISKQTAGMATGAVIGSVAGPVGCRSWWCAWCTRRARSLKGSRCRNNGKENRQEGIAKNQSGRKASEESSGKEIQIASAKKTKASSAKKKSSAKSRKATSKDVARGRVNRPPEVAEKRSRVNDQIVAARRAAGGLRRGQGRVRENCDAKRFRNAVARRRTNGAASKFHSERARYHR